MSNKAYNNHGQLYRGVGPVIRNLSFISKTCNAIEEQKSSEISELSTPIDILCETGQLHIFFHAKKKSQPRELTWTGSGKILVPLFWKSGPKSTFSRLEARTFCRFEFQKFRFFFAWKISSKWVLNWRIFYGVAHSLNLVGLLLSDDQTLFLHQNSDFERVSLSSGLFSGVWWSSSESFCWVFSLQTAL